MRIRNLFVGLAVAVSAFGGEPADSLRQLKAPAEEFVRMPAKYIFQRLEEAARRSGSPALAGFGIECRLDGVGDMRISLSMEGLSLCEALDAVAAATGTTVRYSQNQAQLVSPGDPAVAVAVAEPEPAENRKKVKGKKDGVSFSDIDHSIVFVDTGVGRGSGFIMEMGGKTYFISNQHNFVGAQRLNLRAMNGVSLEPDSFEFCRDRDLIRMELNAENLAGITVLKPAEGTPAIGQSIAVYGNSAGGNVATELTGEILGVGPADIELDADIVSGNSGSPVLNAEGQVLAVATYLTFELEFGGNDARKQVYKGTRFGKTRRYGVRLPEEGWVKADIRNFLNQTYRLVDARNMLEALRVLIEYWNADEDYEEQARRIMSSYSTSGNRIDPPYTFHFSETEEELVMLVKSFTRNFDEFLGLVSTMDVSKSELARMRSGYGKKSTSKAETLDYHIRISLLKRVKRIQDELNQYDWMSEYLRSTAQPLNEMAGELIRVLSSSENPYDRIKEFMK